MLYRRRLFIFFGLMLIINQSIGKNHSEASEDKFRREFQSSPQDGNSIDETYPKKLRLFVKDWIAQWDPLYKAWFYFNPKTDYSTWEKPQELQHLTLDSPIDESRTQYHNVVRHPSSPETLPNYQPSNRQRSQQRSPQVAQHWTQHDNHPRHYNQGTQQYRPFPGPGPAQDKFLEDESGNFFGFNFNSTEVQSRGIFKPFLDSLTYMYENVIESYVEDIYTGVIEDYTIATVKLIGWFFFASAIVVKGAIINGLFGSEKRSFGDDISDLQNLLPSSLKDLELTIPIEGSLFSCYKDRESCLENDLNEEIDLLLSNFVTVKRFYTTWLEMGEKLGHMAVEGELEL